MYFNLFFPYWLLYLVPWGSVLSKEDGVNLARLLHCTYLDLAIIRAVTAMLYVAMSNNSWLISADRVVPKRAAQVTLALLASLWGLPSLHLSQSPTLLLLLWVQLLIADSCLWGLKTASSAEWMAVRSGRWVTGTSIMTRGRCRPRISSRSDGLACNTKARADNGRRLIEKYSSKSWHLPWGVRALLQEPQTWRPRPWCEEPFSPLLSAALWFKWSQRSRLGAVRL